jgi:hypothetical protein
MGSLSKHAGKGLYARVFDRLRLTGPPTSKTKNVMGRRYDAAMTGVYVLMEALKISFERNLNRL